MKVAVEGCCHGELDNIYHTIETARTQAGIQTPDVLICCGDFQSFRNHSDLQTFAAPPKYRQLGSFWKYYNGEKVAPILTIFIGGNHEASGYLWELYHGGWVAPNIYFLGFAGSVILKKMLLDGTIDSIRISGASGIFKKHDYRSGHHERLPYDNGTIRSIYHVREYDIFRMSQLPVSSSSDIFVSHDWPVGIEQHGNTAQLLRAKPFFRDEVASNTLGSPPLMQLLKTIKPHYWFSAHLHVKFAALYHHDAPPRKCARAVNAPAPLNPDELQINLDDDEDEAQHTSSNPPLNNPDMILIDDSDEDEIIVRQGLTDRPDSQTQPLINEPSKLDTTHLGRCGIAVLQPESMQRSSAAPPKLPLINPDMIPVDVSDDDEMIAKKDMANNSVSQTQPMVNESSELNAAHSGIPKISDHPGDTPLTSDATGSASTVLAQENTKTAVESSNLTVEPSQDLQNSSNAPIMRTTRFLALDKCLPRKDFLQILDIPPGNASVEVPIATIQSVPEQSSDNLPEDQVEAQGGMECNQDRKTMANAAASLFFDPHWLAITRAFHSYMPLQKHGNPRLPSDPVEISRLINLELEWVNQNLDPASLEISRVQQFVKTAPGIGDPGGEHPGQPLWYTNPQTLAFTELLDIQNKVNSPVLD